MNIAELKIGNYICFVENNDNIQVNSINIDANLINDTYNAESCVGIPITEAILINNGFSRYRNESESFTGIYYSCNSYILCKHDQEFHLWRSDPILGFLMNDTNLIQYIHTLQNSYFQNTNTELNIQNLG